MNRAASFLPINTSSIALAALTALVIVALPFPIGVAVFPALAAGILILFAPLLVPLGLMLSISVQDSYLLTTPAGSLTITQLLVIISIALTLLLIVTGQIAVPVNQLVLIYFAYTIAILISIVSALDTTLVIAETYRWTVGLLALVLILTLIRSHYALLAIIGAFALTVIIQAWMGLSQSLGGLGPQSFVMPSGISRAFGTFGMPNSYAGYLELAGLWLLPIALWQTRRTWQLFGHFRRERMVGFEHATGIRRAWLIQTGITLLFLGGFLATLIGIGVSFSRGAWIGTTAALLVLIMTFGRKAIVVLSFVALIAAMFVVTGMIDRAPGVVSDRVEQITSQIQIFDARNVIVTEDNFAAVERMAHWQTGIEMWKESPLTGVGAGNFNERFTEFHVHPGFRNSQGHAHNYYIHTMAETGIVGLLAYLALLGTGAWVSLRALRSPKPLSQAIGRGALMMTTALAVHNIVENLHVLNMTLVVVSIWGLCWLSVENDRLNGGNDDLRNSADMKAHIIDRMNRQSVRTRSSES